MMGHQTVKSFKIGLTV